LAELIDTGGLATIQSQARPHFFIDANLNVTVGIDRTHLNIRIAQNQVVRLPGSEMQNGLICYSGITIFEYDDDFLYKYSVCAFFTTNFSCFHKK
jgi:hypothetical protein